MYWRVHARSSRRRGETCGAFIIAGRETPSYLVILLSTATGTRSLSYSPSAGATDYSHILRRLPSGTVAQITREVDEKKKEEKGFRKEGDTPLAPADFTSFGISIR